MREKIVIHLYHEKDFVEGDEMDVICRELKATQRENKLLRNKTVTNNNRLKKLAHDLRIVIDRYAGVRKYLLKHYNRLVAEIRETDELLSNERKLKEKQRREQRKKLAHT